MFAPLSQHLIPSPRLMGECLDRFLGERVVPRMGRLRESHLVFANETSYLAMQVGLALSGYSVIFHFGDASGAQRVAAGVVELNWSRGRWLFVEASLAGTYVDFVQALLAMDPYTELPLAAIEVADAAA